MTALLRKLRSAAERSITRPGRSRNIVAGAQTKPKIFGIGFNKTGTTSLEDIFKHYGYRLPDQNEQERLLTRDVFNNDYARLKEFVEQYDAFQDMPFSQGLSFVACDALFPEAKFILTLRDEDEWFDSLYRFHKKIFGFNDRTELEKVFFSGRTLYLYEGYVEANQERIVSVVKNGRLKVDWSLLYDEAHYKKVYRERNAEIMKYFANRPDKLLVIDVTKEQDTQKFCEFLGIPSDKIIDMPHKNKT